MLTPDEVSDVVRDLWKRHEDERSRHDRVHDYLRGLRGIPEVPEGSGDELEDLARLSVKNVLKIVVDAFAQNLAVRGFRSPSSAEDDPVWSLWQAQRLDARQSEAHRPALAYGASYAVLGTDDNLRLRTPRQMFAVYEDPSFDMWPKYALETWVDASAAKPVRRGVLYDDEHAYTVDLGSIPRVAGSDKGYDRARRIAVTLAEGSGPARPGSTTCPVLRFVNARDAEDNVVGEVYPLITQQRAINAVNFDRLAVSRWGSFPQKYAIGWAAPDRDALIKASVSRLMAFDDEAIQVGSFAAASVEPYNSILEEMLTHVAMEAQIPLAAFGRMANLSADALAMAEAPHQRKLVEKRESFGESWEQVLRLMAERSGGVTVAADAEVIWRDTEARSFAQVVDGIVKLSSAGTPIEALVEDVPGWSKQRADTVRSAIRRTTGRAVAQLAAQSGEAQGAVGPSPPADVKAKADAMGVLIRAGVDPVSAARQVGLDAIEFTGAVPVSLRLPEAQASKVEGK